MPAAFRQAIPEEEKVATPDEAPEEAQVVPQWIPNWSVPWHPEFVEMAVVAKES